MLRTSKVTSAVRPSTRGQLRGRTDRRRRGTIYLLVVAVAANLVVIGLAAIHLARVRVRGVHLEAQRYEAQRLAYSGVEQAIAMMNNYTGGTGNWRADYTNDQETTPLDFGDGQVSFKLVDKDGDLADDATDPLWIYGIGRVGDAVWVERAKARVDQGLPLELLRTTIHSHGSISIPLGAELTVVGAPASTDGTLDVQGTLTGDGEAADASLSGLVSGTTTVPAESKGIPPRTLFDEYIVRATTLTYGGDLNTIVLGPGINEYDGSGANGDGVYYLNTGGNDLTIDTVRVCGTLIVDTDGGAVTIRTCFMKPCREDFPVLMVKGTLTMHFLSPTFIEGIPTNHNFNPPGAPYQGESDSDMTDAYPRGLFGLVHIIGDVTIGNVGTSKGVFVVDGQTTIFAQAAQIMHDPDLMLNPPLGYADDPNSTAMVIRSGSWSRQPAP